MALELKQTVKLSQSLVMTPQLQQAIKLLQLSRLELMNTITQELVENPVLEEALEDESVDTPETAAEHEAAADRDAPETASAEGVTDTGEVASETAADLAAIDSAPEEPAPSTDDLVGDVDWENYMESAPQTSLGVPDERPGIEATHSRETSLADHLLWQLGFADLVDAECEIGQRIIGNLNEDGYLEEPLDAIAGRAGAELELVERVLARLQEFDPVGVCARSLSECLLVQMRIAKTECALALKIARDYLDLLQRKDYRGIARLEEVTIEEVAEAARIIGSFEPRPGREFANGDPIYIEPDIYVHKVDDAYHVVLNEDGMPRLRVSNAYREVLARKASEAKETREYVREKLRSAVWLIKSIHQRQRTIVRVMESIIRFQRDFFDKGAEYMRPLNLRDVADDIGMHESTVSRVTTNKYAQTPHGVFELKYFFNSSIKTGDGDAIASESVKEKISGLIKNEDPRKPLSDQKIAEILKARNIHIARRTVTKYREALRILSSTRRREIG